MRLPLFFLILSLVGAGCAKTKNGWYIKEVGCAEYGSTAETPCILKRAFVHSPYEPFGFNRFYFSPTSSASEIRSKFDEYIKKEEAAHAERVRQQQEEDRFVDEVNNP